MTEMFNVRDEYAVDGLTEAAAEAIAVNLTAFSASVSAPARGRVSVRITIPATDAGQAARAAAAVTAEALDAAGLGGAAHVGIEVLTERDFDAREQFEAVPELVSVGDIAARLGISRQAALRQLKESGHWRTAQFVGGSWVASRSELDERAARARS